MLQNWQSESFLRWERISQKINRKFQTFDWIFSIARQKNFIINSNEHKDSFFFRFLAKIIPVPISPKKPIKPKLRRRLRFLSRITLSTSWMRSYFKIGFYKFTFLNFGSLLTIWNRKFQNSKMGIDVFNLSCKEFFFGHFKTKNFFGFEIF